MTSTFQITRRSTPTYPADLVRHPKLIWIGKPTDDNPQTRPFAHIFRSDPLAVAPPSFSSILLQPRPQAIIQMTENSNETSSSSTLSTPEADVGYQDEWDDMRIIEANKSDDDWTEARRKPAKKVIANAGGGGGGRKRERSGRRGLAGTNNNPSSSGRDKDRRNKRGGKGRRDRERESMNVRDLKPRPCHSHYLSEYSPFLPAFSGSVQRDKKRERLMERSKRMHKRRLPLRPSIRSVPHPLSLLTLMSRTKHEPMR